MADPFLSRPAPPRSTSHRTRQRTPSSAAGASPSLSTSHSAREVATSPALTPAGGGTDDALSPDALLSHLRSLYASKTKEIQIAGRLGESLLAQQAELASHLHEHEAADTRRARATGGVLSLSESTRIAEEVRRTRERLDTSVAAWERTNDELYRSAGVANRRGETVDGRPPERHARQQHMRPADEDLAAALEQNLVGEVRRLHVQLADREDTIRGLHEARDHLVRDHEPIAATLKAHEESLERFKEENWNLELAVQELRTTQAEAIDAAQRAESERARLAKALSTARESYDATRAEADRHLAAVEALRAKHETSMAEARKAAATLQREKSDLQAALDTAQAQLTVRHMARHPSGLQQSPNASLTAAATVPDVDMAAGGDDDDDETDAADDPFAGRSTEPGRPRGSILPKAGSPAPSLHAGDAIPATNDVTQLRQALAHRQRTIETLRAALQREKEARIRGKRTADAAAEGDDDDESDDRDGSPVQARKVSRRGVARRGIVSRRDRLPSRLASHLGDDDMEDLDASDENVAPDGPGGAREPADLERDELAMTDVPAVDDQRLVKGSLASLDPAFANDSLDEAMHRSVVGDRVPSLRHHGSRESLASLASLRQAGDGRLTALSPLHGPPTQSVDRAVTTDSIMTSDAASQVDSLTARHEAALAEVQRDHDVALQHLRDEHLRHATASREEQRRLLDDAASRHATMLSQARSAHLADLDRLRSGHEETVRSHQASLEDVHAQHEAALVQTRDEHARERVATVAAHTEALDALRKGYDLKLDDLRAQLARAFDERDQALRRVQLQHEQTLSSLTSEHAATLAQRDEGAQTAREEHATAIGSLRAAHAAALDAVAVRHAGELDLMRTTHAADLSRQQSLHAAALQQLDADRQRDLSDLRQQLSSEQDAALSAAAANEEQAAAISTLKDLHSKAMEAAAGRHASTIADLRQAHLVETERTRVEHTQAVQRSRDRAQQDLKAIRATSEREQSEAVAAVTQNADAAAAHVAKQHAAQTSALRAEGQRALEAAAAEHAKAMTAALADADRRHATALSSVQQAHAQSLRAAEDAKLSIARSLEARHQQALAASAAAHHAALESAIREARSEALASTPRHTQRRSIASVDGGYKSAADDGTETEGETDFEDAAETLAPPHLLKASMRSSSAQTVHATDRRAVATIDAGVQTDHSGPPPAVPPPAKVSETATKARVDGTKATRTADMPPPGSMPPPRAVSPRKSTSSAMSLSGAPARPISPPPPDLLQRATSPGLLMPTTARQESVGTNGAAPIKRPRLAASTPSFVSTAPRPPRLQASLSDFGTSTANGLRTSNASSASFRSRAHSVASSHTSEGDHVIYGAPISGAGLSTSTMGTDPMVIHAITQTMIGEYLHKYTRARFGKTTSENRHKRFFWVHPYTKTLYWSGQDPAAQNVTQQNAKSVFIEGVRTVYDPNPHPSGLCQHSLIIATPTREIKLTASTQERHDMWYSAITYLLSRPESATPGTPSSRSSAFSPRRGDRAGSAAAMHRQGSAPAAMYGGQASADPKLAASRSPGSLSTSRWGTRSRGRMSAASALQLKRADTPAAQYLSETNDVGSPRSVRSFGGSDALFHDEGAGVTNAADVSYEPEQVDDEDGDGFEGLENVRVCCGEHDVGRLSTSRHRHSHAHEHQSDERPTSPSLGVGPPSTKSSVPAARQSTSSMFSSRASEGLAPPIRGMME